MAAPSVTGPLCDMAGSCFARPIGCSGRLRYLGGVMLEELVGVHGFRSYYYCSSCEKVYCLQWVEADGSLSIWTMDEDEVREALSCEAAHWKKSAIAILENYISR